MSRRFRIIASIACGLLAAVVSLVYADGVRREAQRVRAETLARYGGEVVNLVVARDGLEPGDVASTANVELREWLSDLAPEGALLVLDDCVGREVSVPAAKGAPLTDINFRDTSLVADVPEGHVALAIPVTDKLGVPRDVAVGSALYAYQVGSDAVNLIASDMTVLASAGASGSYASVLQLTVAVRPEDVPAVLAASASNDLRLVMPAKGAGASTVSSEAAVSSTTAAHGGAAAGATPDEQSAVDELARGVGTSHVESLLSGTSASRTDGTDGPKDRADEADAKRREDARAVSEAADAASVTSEG